MLSGALILIGISFLILLHEAGHFIAAKRAGLLVEEFGFGFPPRLAHKKIGETVYSLNWLPFGGFVRVHGEKTSDFEGTPEKRPLLKERAFVYQSLWTRFIIVGAGVAVNFLLGWFLLSLTFFIGTPQSIVVTELAENTPAAEAGILEGDTLLYFADSAEFVAFINQQRGQEVILDFQRDGEVRSVSVTPRFDPPIGEGALGLAVSDFGFEGVSFVKSIWDGLVFAVTTTGEIFVALFLLVANLFQSGRIAEEVIGPIGILSFAGELGQAGYVYLIQLIALISLNLAVLNILPIPALDGGRILFLIIEKIKGAPIAPKKELAANAISFVVLFMLMIVITVRDVIRLF